MDDLTNSMDVEAQEVRTETNKPTPAPAACQNCRARKRKCDGKAPCSYCSSKNLECQFIKRRKRGPNKKPKIDTISLPTSTHLQMAVHAITPPSLDYANYECQMGNKLESLSYMASFYVEYAGTILPFGGNLKKMLAPDTDAHKVQAYSMLAIAARVCGDYAKSRTYISQARILAGSIFDAPDKESISAMLLLAHYWHITLDNKLSHYYINLACGLVKLSPIAIRGRLGAYCEVATSLLNDALSSRQKADMVRGIMNRLLQSDDPQDKVYAGFLHTHVAYLGIFDLNFMFPDLSQLHNIFNNIDNITVSEAERTELLKTSESVLAIVDTCFTEMFKSSLPECSLYISGISCPMLRAFCEWKSGHVEEAMKQSIATLQAVQRLHATVYFGILSKYCYVVSFSLMAKFFHQHKQDQMALQMCGFVKSICNIMKPDYDGIAKIVDDYMVTHLCIPSSPINTVVPFTPTIELEKASSLDANFNSIYNNLYNNVTQVTSPQIQELQTSVEMLQDPLSSTFFRETDGFFGNSSPPQFSAQFTSEGAYQPLTLVDVENFLTNTLEI